MRSGTAAQVTARPLDVHRISRDSLRAIAAGHADDADLSLLRSVQRSQLLLILRALRDQAEDAARRVRHRGAVPSVGGAWQLLCKAELHAPEAVEAVLGDPTVMAWALRLLRRLGGTPSDSGDSAAPLWADIGQFHAVAAAAALRAGVPAVLRVPAHRGTVWLPGTGVAGPVARRRWSEAQVHVEADGALVHGELTRVRLTAPLSEPAPGWRPLRALDLPTRRAAGGGPWLDTVTPYRDFTRSPKAPGRTGERRLRLWEDRLAGAYALLDTESPADAAAVAALVRTFVPRTFRTTRGGQVASASSLDAFGAVTLSLPYDDVQTAAVLVHEMRHQQLNALLSLVPLVGTEESEESEEPGESGQPGGERLHYAPWRSDPRPVHGLLHGVFAFAGVAQFWRRHRRHVAGTEADRAAFEFAVLREQVREAVTALAGDDALTEAGRLFAGELAALVRDWRGDPVLGVPGALARHYCAHRRALWRARHLEFAESAAMRLAAAWRAGDPPPEPGPVSVRPRLELTRLDTFGPLIRHRLTAPERFARRRRQAERDGSAGRRAEYAAAAGDAGQAAAAYAEWAAADPLDAEPWIGAVLAVPEQDREPAAVLLLERPELVAAVRRQVATDGGGHPDPLRLAAWLGGL
ncbi:HEXXH motif domain-containing protein [Streptomyces sp. V3I7]|uniref:HEXXH motif domain-containing protein n=1 Tax=Streptomyces sp. V3I7 TaxID=3042278 RepID=UPI002784ADEE|nr:HEXXH motif domain-containing protein [Streptomyces sp. V3I7]MDQ0992342.1 HEXXH motif-containing protein [Streptomyces sp. V3I7]